MTHGVLTTFERSTDGVHEDTVLQLQITRLRRRDVKGGTQCTSPSVKFGTLLVGVLMLTSLTFGSFSTIPCSTR